MEASNVRAMREALEQIASMGEQIDHQLGSSEETVYAFRHERCLAHNISECARAALSAPPRNCDVGTEEGQLRRYKELCDRHTCGSRCSASGCPLYDYDCSPLAWGQMPYEEGGENGK